MNLSTFSPQFLHITIPAKENRRNRGFGLITGGLRNNVVLEFRRIDSPGRKWLRKGDIILDVMCPSRKIFGSQNESWRSLFHNSVDANAVITSSSGSLAILVKRGGDYTLEEEHGLFWRGGKLLHIRDCAPFNFEFYSGDHVRNCFRFERVASLCTSSIGDYLEHYLGLMRQKIPATSVPGDQASFIYVSPGIESRSTVVVLIQGSGNVRSGQWSRRLLVNFGYDSGSQIPYITRALQRGFGVAVLNPNDRINPDTGVTVQGSASNVEHCITSWNTLFSNYKAGSFVFIAHSAGGQCVYEMVSCCGGEILRRVSAIVLLDTSVNYTMGTPWEFMKSVGRHWKRSTLPVETKITEDPGSMATVSAGTTDHDAVPNVSVLSVWNFIDSATVSSHFAPSSAQGVEFSSNLNSGTGSTDSFSLPTNQDSVYPDQAPKSKTQDRLEQKRKWYSFHSETESEKKREKYRLSSQRTKVEQKSRYIKNPEQKRRKELDRYYAEPEKRRAKERERYRADPVPKITKELQKYYAEPEKRREKERDKYLLDPETKRTKELQKYYAEPEKRREKEREKYHLDPETKRTKELQNYYAEPEKRREKERDKYHFDPVPKITKELQKYYAEPEKRREKEREKYHLDPETKRTKELQKYYAEPEKRREKERDKYHFDPVPKITKELQKYYAEPEKRREKEREKYHLDPEKKIEKELAKYHADSETRRKNMRNHYALDPENKRSKQRELYRLSPGKKKHYSRQSYALDFMRKRLQNATNRLRSITGSKAVWLDKWRALSQKKYMESPLEKIARVRGRKMLHSGAMILKHIIDPGSSAEVVQRYLKVLEAREKEGLAQFSPAHSILKRVEDKRQRLQLEDFCVGQADVLDNDRLARRLSRMAKFNIASVARGQKRKSVRGTRITEFHRPSVPKPSSKEYAAQMDRFKQSFLSAAFKEDHELCDRNDMPCHQDSEIKKAVLAGVTGENRAMRSLNNSLTLLEKEFHKKKSLCSVQWNGSREDHLRQIFGEEKVHRKTAESFADRMNLDQFRYTDLNNSTSSNNGEESEIHQKTPSSKRRHLSEKVDSQSETGREVEASDNVPIAQYSSCILFQCNNGSALIQDTIYGDQTFPSVDLAFRYLAVQFKDRKILKVAEEEKFHLLLSTSTGNRYSKSFDTVDEALSFLQSSRSKPSTVSFRPEETSLPNHSSLSADSPTKHTEGATGESVRDKECDPFEAVNPTEEKKLSGNYRKCDATCCEPPWAERLEQRLSSIFTRKNVGKLGKFKSNLPSLGEFLILEDCRECLESSELCDIETCTDLFRLLIEVQPHYKGVRTLLRKLYRIRRVAMWIVKLRACFMQGSLDELVAHIKLYPDSEQAQKLVTTAQRIPATTMAAWYEDLNARCDVKLRDVPTYPCDSCGVLGPRTTKTWTLLQKLMKKRKMKHETGPARNQPLYYSDDEDEDSANEMFVPQCADENMGEIAFGDAVIAFKAKEGWFIDEDGWNDAMRLFRDWCRSYPDLAEGRGHPQVICNNCYSAMSKNCIPVRSAMNGMAVDPIPSTLPNLTYIEKMLVQKAKPFVTLIHMNVVRGKRPTNQSMPGSKGNVVHLPQDIIANQATLTRTLRLPYLDDLYRIIVKGLPGGSAQRRYVRENVVNLRNVHEWLVYLKATNPFYKDDIIMSLEEMQSHVPNALRIDFLEQQLGAGISEDETKSILTHLVGSDRDPPHCQQTTLIPVDPRTLPDKSNIEIYEQSRIEATPLNFYATPNLDVICFPFHFPSGRFGINFDRPKKIGNSEYGKCRIKHKDPRWRKDIQYSFHSANRKDALRINRACYAQMLAKKLSGMTAGELKAAIFSKSPALDASLRTLLGQMIGTHEYFRIFKNNLDAIVREHGPPTFFLTITLSEFNSNIFREALRRFNPDWLSADVMQIGEMTAADPAAVAIISQHYFNIAFNEFIRSKEAPLGRVENYAFRKEYQSRGWPHWHCLLWIKDAPLVPADGFMDEAQKIELIEFVEQKITCEIPSEEEDPTLHRLVTTCQNHNHTSTCLRTAFKGGSSTKYCRFNFPRDPCASARIREPEAVVKSRCKKGHGLQLIELARTALETFINPYNPALLHFLRSNMDIQYVADCSYCLVEYIGKYISKPEIETAADFETICSDDSKSPQSSLMKYLWSLNATRSIGLVEQIDKIIGHKIIGTSAVVRWISLGLSKGQRVRRMKSKSVIEDLPEESTEIAEDNLLDVFYPHRHDDLENVCLHEIVARFDHVKQAPSSKKRIAFECKNNKGYFVERSTRTIPNWAHYSGSTPEAVERNSRASVLLFFPWRNEDDLRKLAPTWREIFDLREVQANVSDAARECRGALARLDQCRDQRERWEAEAAKEEEEEENALREGNEDAAEKGGKGVGEIIESKIDETDLIENLILLEKNKEQWNFFVHMMEGIEHQEYHRLGNDNLKQSEESQSVPLPTLRRQDLAPYVRPAPARQLCGPSCKDSTTPIRMILSGMGGSGKSFLIKCLRWSLAKKYGGYGAAVVASTGVAASQIGGVTAHRFFKILVQHGEKFKGRVVPIDPESAEALRASLLHIKLIIIDEISMISNVTLAEIHSHLSVAMRKLRKPNSFFGDVNLLLTGDFFQLPPVQGSMIFSTLKPREKQYLQLPIGPTNLVDGPDMHGEPLFGYRELTSSVRQSDDTQFRDLLENVRLGTLTEDQIKVLETRVVIQSAGKETEQEAMAGYLCNLRKLSPTAIAVAPTNEKVDSINRTMLVLEGISCFSFSASDTGRNKKGRKISKPKTSVKISETGGLPTTLVCGVNARVMLRRNLSVEEGLVNGSLGTVETLPSGDADFIGVRFDGDPAVVPIKKAEVTFHWRGIEVARKQFPLVLAYAITIHKCQGITVSDLVCSIDWGSSEEGMVYVAMSRVKKLENLHLASFHPSAIACRLDAANAYRSLRSRSLVLPGENPLPPLPPCNDMPLPVKALRAENKKKFPNRNLIKNRNKIEEKQLVQLLEMVASQAITDPQLKPTTHLTRSDEGCLNLKCKSSSCSFCSSIAQCLNSFHWFLPLLNSLDLSTSDPSSFRVIAALKAILSSASGQPQDCSSLQTAVIRFHVDSCPVCGGTPPHCIACRQTLALLSGESHEPVEFLSLLISCLPENIQDCFRFWEEKTYSCAECKFSWMEGASGIKKTVLHLDEVKDGKNTWNDLLSRHFFFEKPMLCHGCGETTEIMKQVTIHYPSNHRVLIVGPALAASGSDGGMRKMADRKITGFSTAKFFIQNRNFCLTTALYHCGSQAQRFCSIHRHGEQWNVITVAGDRSRITEVKKSFPRNLRLSSEKLAYLLFFETSGPSTIPPVVTAVSAAPTFIQDVKVTTETKKKIQEGFSKNHSVELCVDRSSPLIPTAEDRNIISNQENTTSSNKPVPLPSFKTSSPLIRPAPTLLSLRPLPFLRLENYTNRCFSNAVANCIHSLPWLRDALKKATLFLAKHPDLQRILVDAVLELFDLDPSSFHSTHRLCRALVDLLLAECNDLTCDPENRCPTCLSNMEFLGDARQCDADEFLLRILENLPDDAKETFLFWENERRKCTWCEFSQIVEKEQEPSLIMFVTTENRRQTWNEMMDNHFNFQRNHYCYRCGIIRDHAISLDLRTSPAHRGIFCTIPAMSYDPQSRSFHRYEHRFVSSFDPDNSLLGGNRFRLKAAILHRGDSPHAGHYISTRCFHDDWIIIDDFDRGKPKYSPRAHFNIAQNGMKFSSFLVRSLILERTTLMEPTSALPGSEERSASCLSPRQQNHSVDDGKALSKPEVSRGRVVYITSPDSTSPNESFIVDHDRFTGCTEMTQFRSEAVLLLENTTSVPESDDPKIAVHYPVQFIGSIAVDNNYSSMDSYRIVVETMLNTLLRSRKHLIPMTISVFKRHFTICNRSKTVGALCKTFFLLFKFSFYGTLVSQSLFNTFLDCSLNACYIEELSHGRVALSFADAHLYDGALEYSLTSQQDSSIVAIIVRGSNQSNGNGILWGFKSQGFSNFLFSRSGVLTLFGEKGQRESAMIRSRNFSTLSLADVAHVWHTSVKRMERFMERKFKRPTPKRVYSCAIDSFLDLTQEHFSVYLLDIIIPQRCSSRSFDPTCQCLLCLSLGSFTKLLLQYAQIRRGCCNRRSLMNYTNVIWNALIIRPETNLKPKGTIDAAPQSIPQLLQCKGFNIASGTPPVVGIWREAQCPLCSTQNMIAQLLLPFDLLYLHNESSFQAVVQNNLIMVSHSCPVHQVLLTPTEFVYGDFVIFNFNLDDSQDPNATLFEDNITLGGSSYQLMGLVKHLGNHFVAIVKDNHGFVVMDDMIENDNMLISGPLQYCLKSLGGNLFQGVFFILFRKC